MARTCEVCGKKPVVGNQVSHANNRNSAGMVSESPESGALCGFGERIDEADQGVHPLL